jgi:hypothetical protein
VGVVMVRSSLALSAIAAIACGHPARPTVTGAELYAQVHTLEDTGQATIGTIAIHKGQVLTTSTQIFAVEQVIDKCRGGDPSTDVDCALALLLDQRFTVLDHPPRGRAAGADHEDQSRPIMSSAAVIGVGTVAVGALVYGAATCDFAGCRYVFGVPLVFVGAAALFLVSRD